MQVNRREGTVRVRPSPGQRVAAPSWLGRITGRLPAYLLAGAATAATAVLHHAVDVSSGSTYSLLFVVVLASAALGGFGPGVIATVARGGHEKDTLGEHKPDCLLAAMLRG
jgi:hypothetical protein